MDKDIKDIEKALLEDEHISRFLQGLMNASEETAFLEELKSNKELRQRDISFPDRQKLTKMGGF